MKTLYASSSNTILNNNLSKTPSSRRALLLRPQQVSFLPSEKLLQVAFSHLVSVKHRPFCPFRASSSLMPDSQELETTENQNQDQLKTVRVKFLLQKGCSFGEQFAIVGNDPMLGLWDPENAIPLNWSDGHVWTVELDMPIGKSVQFKFLLKGAAGSVLWQPGPDRILETWECSNTIVVYEDWENAALQNIMEEEPFVNQNDEPAINSEMLLVSDMDKKSALADVSSCKEKEQLAMTSEKLVVADNIVLPLEKRLHIVADNISHPEEVPAEYASNEVLDEYSTSSKSIVSHEGDPVLVPGLTPLPASPGALVHDEGEKGIALDASLGAKHHKLPELNEKQEIEGDALQEEIVNLVNDEEQMNDEFKQKRWLDDKKEVNDDAYEETVNMVSQKEQLDNEFKQKQHEWKHDGDDVLGNDIQWGRKTLQKLLNNLGLLR